MKPTSPPNRLNAGWTVTSRLLAIDPDLAAVAQPGAIFFLGSDHACLSPNPGLQ